MSSKSGQNVDIVWAENGLLITATGEHSIRRVCNRTDICKWIRFSCSKVRCVSCFRLWDLEREDNYVLSLDESLGFETGEMINCVTYCAVKG